MRDTILMRQERQLTPIPREAWEHDVSTIPQHIDAGLGFMSEAHHLVRYFVVRELPRLGEPLSPEFIAQQLHLPMARVRVILDELEKHLTFLFRNAQGAVAWAYPVTVDHTPHHVTFSTGEQVHAAGGIDAIAVPFVQGQLRRQPLTVDIRTACAHCAQPMHIVLDSELQYRVVEEQADPLVFKPLVDFDTLTEASIIDAFGRHSVFFWSEEHARACRPEAARMDGQLLTLEQGAYYTRIVQGALFGFT